MYVSYIYPNRAMANPPGRERALPVHDVAFAIPDPSGRPYALVEI